MLTLSKTTFDIGETQVSGRANTSLKGTSYGLPDVESTLDFKFNTSQKGKVQMDCSYVNNGLQVMTLGALLTLPETGNLIECLSTNDFNGSRIDFDMQILNDLKFYGSIRDVAQFSEAFMKITLDKDISSTDFSSHVDKLNQYSEITKQVILKKSLNRLTNSTFVSRFSLLQSFNFLSRQTCIFYNRFNR